MSDLMTIEQTPMQLITKLLADGAQVADMTALFDLQERHEKREAQKLFASRVTRFQNICPPVPKTKPVHNRSGALMYHFADYADLMEIIQPYLTQLEIVPTFSFEKTGDQMFAICRIRVGEWVEETRVPAAIPEILNANEAQNCGGATSFGKRSSLTAALNIRIVGEDNDAADVSDTLTDDEAGVLKQMIDEVTFMGGKASVKGLSNWLREGATKLTDIPRSQFAVAVAEMNRKRAECEKGK